MHGFINSKRVWVTLIKQGIIKLKLLLCPFIYLYLLYSSYFFTTMLWNLCKPLFLTVTPWWEFMLIKQYHNLFCIFVLVSCKVVITRREQRVPCPPWTKFYLVKIIVLIQINVLWCVKIEFLLVLWSLKFCLDELYLPSFEFQKCCLFLVIIDLLTQKGILTNPLYLSIILMS